MICKDNQPFAVVEDPGFNYLMKIISPNFKMPSWREISRKIFNLHESIKTHFTDKLKNVQHLILIMDIWTDIQIRSYVGITIHFTEDHNLKSDCWGFMN